MTNPPGAMPPLPTHEELEMFASEMARNEQLLWAGFRQDADGFYSIPVVSDSHAKLAFAFAKAYAAPLIARVEELQAEREKLREAIDNAAFEYSRYIVEDTAHTTLSLYMMDAFDAAIAAKD